MVLFDRFEIRDQITEMLGHVVEMWNEKGLTSYRIIFRWRPKYKKWELYCPEFGEGWQSTSQDDIELHRYTMVWKGFSQAYWLGNILMQELPRASQDKIVRELLHRQLTKHTYSNRVRVVEMTGDDMTDERKEKLLWS
jgi:hypothetical protein